MSSPESSRPGQPTYWYREPWAWLVLGIPAATIIWCIILFNIATSQPVSLVSDDYYNDGMGINREVRRDLQAAALDLSAQVEFRDQGKIHITLHSGAASGAAIAWDALSVELIHPTLDNRDRLLTATAEGDNTFIAHAENLMNGRWYLDIRDSNNEWRLKGETTLPETKVVTLNPRREAPST